QTQIIGVVGTDFSSTHIDFLQGRGVDVSGLQRLPGRTFRWSGRYHYDMNSRDTLDTQLGLFADFEPKLSQSHRGASTVFLANINPALQLGVLDQMLGPRLVALDTMNFWIESERELLTKVIGQVDMLLMNDAECLQFAETPSLLRAAKALLSLGPKVLVVKRGEYGAALFAEGSYFFSPAYPLEDVKDPTGAGDTFAGGLLGYLDRSGDYSIASIKRAVVYASTAASFTVEDFSLDRLRAVTMNDIERRVSEFKHFTDTETEAIFGPMRLNGK
ncbi:MAG: sugar kinase, partial [Chloroflexota bacterium]|nr:sugar kinase [Chloroflexota bacterium]